MTKYTASALHEGIFSFMQHLDIRLLRNEREQNWTVTINGKSYKSVSIEAVKELVLRAVAIAEGSMVDPTRHTQ
jgi:hypothetical protein